MGELDPIGYATTLSADEWGWRKRAKKAEAELARVLELNKPAPAPTPVTCDCTDRKVLERAGYMWRAPENHPAPSSDFEGMAMWYAMPSLHSSPSGSSSIGFYHCPYCHKPLPDGQEGDEHGR